MLPPRPAREQKIFSLKYAQKNSNEEASLGCEDIASTGGKNLSSDTSKVLVNELYHESPIFQERLISRSAFSLKQVKGMRK